TAVVLARGCAAVLFHEILAHALEGDADRSPLSSAPPGPLTAVELDVRDDPRRLDLFGGYEHDDEGVAPRAVKLVHSGRTGPRLRPGGGAAGLGGPRRRGGGIRAAAAEVRQRRRDGGVGVLGGAGAAPRRRALDRRDPRGVGRAVERRVPPLLPPRAARAAR